MFMYCDVYIVMTSNANDVTEIPLCCVFSNHEVTPSFELLKCE